VPRRLLPPPEDLAALQLQLAFWPGLERADWPKRSRVVLACCHLDHDRVDNLARRRANARRRTAGAATSLPHL
jgi:hypothetical protein